jgi:hypothetical protein
MLIFLIILTAAVIVAGMALGFSRSRDVFHPAVLLGPILLFLYVWMPLKLIGTNSLSRFFHPEQLWFVQTVNCLGIAALVIGCLYGTNLHWAQQPDGSISEQSERRLVVGSIITGGIGFAAWLVTIRNVGGVSEAFSHPYSGGWDDSGYVRDGSLLMFAATALAMPVFVNGRRRLTALIVMAGVMLPWAIQALFTSRRGPTFMIVAFLGVGWCLNRQYRPPVLVVAVAGAVLGYGILFLVANRRELYIGSQFNLKTGVISSFLQSDETGNEYVYGSGSMIGAHYTGNYFWGRRYLAQILVRPIPSAIWPTKYEDFGVAEVLQNAGTGTNIREALSWEGAPGSAPGLVADVWIEISWMVVPALLLIGIGYGSAWKRAVQFGGRWAGQYTILAALSIYLVMQTLEAVIFRFFLLSIPIWLTWWLANRAKAREMDYVEYTLQRSLP